MQFGLKVWEYAVPPNYGIRASIQVSATLGSPSAYAPKSCYNDHAISTGTELEFKDVIGLTSRLRQAGP